MTTKEYLGQIIRFERDTRNKIREIQRYRDMSVSITVQNNADRVQTSSDKDKIGSIVAKITDLEQEIADITVKRDKIIRQIEKIDDADSSQILYSYFVDGENVYTIRDIVHCSRTQIYKLFDKSLEDFKQKYGKTYLSAKEKR